MRETGATLTSGPLPCYRGVPLTILFCTVDLKALPWVAQWPSAGAGRTGENTMSSTTLRVIREEHGTLAAILRSLRMLAERGPGKEPGTFFDQAYAAMLAALNARVVGRVASSSHWGRIALMCRIAP